jgi:hypothetical protein
MEAEYHLVSHWRVPGPLEDVAAILREPTTSFAGGRRCTWISRSRSKTLGTRSSVSTPVAHFPTLRWSFREVESRWPHGATIEAWADLAGRGVWTLVQEGSDVLATYDWQVRADKPWLRRLSPMLKPLFAVDHRWAMAKGEAGLRREMDRRREALGSAG